MSDNALPLVCLLEHLRSWSNGDIQFGTNIGSLMIYISKSNEILTVESRMTSCHCLYATKPMTLLGLDNSREEIF